MHAELVSRGAIGTQTLEADALLWFNQQAG